MLSQPLRRMLKNPPALFSLRSEAPRAAKSTTSPLSLAADALDGLFEHPANRSGALADNFHINFHWERNEFLTASSECCTRYNGVYQDEIRDFGI